MSEPMTYHVQVPVTGDTEIQLMLSIMRLMEIHRTPRDMNLRALLFLIDRMERERLSEEWDGKSPL